MSWVADGFGSDRAMEVPGWVDRLAPPRGETTTATINNVSSNPLSSWSMERAEADRFAAQVELAGERVPGVGMVTSMTVPVSRVLSSPFTGLGCLSEYELVLVWGDGKDSAHAVIASYDGVDPWGIED